VENFISPIIMAHLLLVRLWRKILSWDQKGAKAGFKCAPTALFPGHVGGSGEEALPFPLGLGMRLYHVLIYLLVVSEFVTKHLHP